MVSGSAWCGRLTVTQEKGNSESDGFNSRRDRIFLSYTSMVEWYTQLPQKQSLIGSQFESE